MMIAKNLIAALLLTVSLASATEPQSHEPKPTAYEQINDQSNLKILTPVLAERKSAKVRLKNGLEAYLISDPGIEQSAAALAIEVGSWHDPKEYPGMAHFLEHMLFMGNEAFPDESEYMRYISDNGGLVNAYTASDRTVYMFSVNNEAFEGALDRFSHFFIDPLFSPASIGRELHAVDQEHAKNIENDGWRQYMIFKETGNPNHPNAKFSTGNAKTLKGIPQKAMKEWYQSHYTASKMHLIVLSALPLDELIQMATADFSKVPVHQEAIASIEGSMTSPRQRGHFIYVKPVKDLKILSLTWEMPTSCATDKETKAGDLIAYALKSGSAHTLKDSLKRAGLAEDLHATQESFSKQHKLFSLEIQVTELGLSQLDTVIQYCFDALGQLKKSGIPQYVFDEVRTMAQLKYQYQSRQEAFDFVKEQASHLVDEELSTYPQKSIMPTHYNGEIIHRYLSHLTPENCLFTVIAEPEKTAIAPTTREKWMGAEYALVTPESKKLVAWRSSSTLPAIELPPSNPYMPTDLVKNPSNSAAPSKNKVVPQLLVDDASCKVYFATDEYYLVPEIAHSFRIHSPVIDGTARSKALTDLYLKALEEKLIASLSMAESAGLDAQFSQENFHLLINISGYRSKAPALAAEVFEALKTVQPTREEFQLFKRSLASSYDNASKELPFVQSYELLSNILFNCTPLNADKWAALETISYEDFIHFSSELFQKIYVEALLFGNLTETEAQNLWSGLKNLIDANPYPRSEQFTRKVLVLPEHQGPYMIVQKTAMQGNAALLLIEEGPYTFEKRAAQQVLAKALKEDFFDTLRTKQQTAYIARSWASEEEGHLLHYFIVQSSSHEPNELIARFELFLESFLKHFSVRLPQERFENMRKMLITSLQMRPENLSGLSKRLTTLAFEYNGDFDLIEKRIASLESLTYGQIHQLAEEFFARSNTQRLAVLTEGVLPKEKSFRYVITNQDSLRGQGTYLAWK